MIPEDRFGRTIYPKLFRILQENGRILAALGYVESQRKPNLFLYKIPEGVLFANMRGTPEVAMWDDQRPLSHWKFVDKVAMWKRRRLIKAELERLWKAHCPGRLFFYLYATPEFENTGSDLRDEEQGIYSWPDGFCSVCGKDFRDEGDFCSADCKLKYERSLIVVCTVCGAEERFWDEPEPPGPMDELCAVCNKQQCAHNSIEHHISYFPEDIISVHRGCHLRIHRTDNFPELKPTQWDTKRFYSKGDLDLFGSGGSGKRGRRGHLPPTEPNG